MSFVINAHASERLHTLNDATTLDRLGFAIGVFYGQVVYIFENGVVSASQVATVTVLESGCKVRLLDGHELGFIRMAPPAEGDQGEPPS